MEKYTKQLGYITKRPLTKNVCIKFGLSCNKKYKKVQMFEIHMTVA